MHSEHLENVHVGWVVGGWALAILGVAAVMVVGGVLIPALREDLVLLAAGVVVGFFAAGLMIGMRWADAPILHAAAVTLLSVVVTFAGSVLLPDSLGGDVIGSEAPEVVLGLILLQFVSAAVGGRFGRRLVRSGEEPGVLA